jgi:hypothetical protein
VGQAAGAGAEPGLCGYQAINQTPGVTPGLQLQGPEAATTVRVENGQTLTTDGPFVTYLIFNEGYGGRGELGAEAIRLGRALAELQR